MLKIINNKKLLFPQEIDVWYVIPAIRRNFALEMIKLGLSQKKVAEILGITAAAVSQYKKEKRAKDIEFPLHLQLEVKESVKKVIENPHSLFHEMMRVNSEVKKSGLFCKIHKEKSWTPSNCEHACEFGGEFK